MPVFAFLDESGDYTYTQNASKFLIFAGIVTANPVLFSLEFAELKYRLLARDHCLDKFHATTDKQSVRDHVFGILSKSKEYAIHSIVIRKNRVNPSIRKYGVYSVAYRTMLKYLVGGGRMDKIHIIVDNVPDRKQQAGLVANLRNRAQEALGKHNIPYTIDHHSSSAHALLQAADYCAWAIYKKWHANDVRSYSLIESRISNEFDMYRGGTIDYY